MSGQMPQSSGPPPGKKGLSTGAIVAIVIVAVVLLLFGICVATVMASGG